LAAAVRSLTSAPWQVVITHAHFDHCFGTSAFLPASVWAHRLCAVRLAETGEMQRRLWAQHYRDNGRPDIAAALKEAPLVTPQRLFDRRRTLSVDGRTVVLAHLGRGHTDHDVVVWLPDDGVLFAGDLVENGAPPAFEDAYPLAWPSTVDNLLALSARTIVAGHGNPVDQAFVRAQRDELAAVAQLCHRHMAGEPVHTLLAESPYPPEVTRIALLRVTAAST
jgi:glyoxylase-like metal-dependent hydrolase (beta-lactamase superfamily II)